MADTLGVGVGTVVCVCPSLVLYLINSGTVVIQWCEGVWSSRLRCCIHDLAIMSLFLGRTQHYVLEQNPLFHFKTLALWVEK